MIRHIVLFTFLDEAEGKTKEENVRETRAMLDALPGKIPLIKNSETFVRGENTAADNADLMLISDFDSREDLAAYIVHPDHKAVGAFMGPRRKSRCCIDLEI